MFVQVSFLFFQLQPAAADDPLSDSTVFKGSCSFPLSPATSSIIKMVDSIEMKMLYFCILYFSLLLLYCIQLVINGIAKQDKSANHS